MGTLMRLRSEKYMYVYISVLIHTYTCFSFFQLISAKLEWFVKGYVPCSLFSFPRAVIQYAHFMTHKKKQTKGSQNGKNRACATRDKVKCSNIHVIGTTQ